MLGLITIFTNMLNMRSLRGGGYGLQKKKKTPSQQVLLCWLFTV